MDRTSTFANQVAKARLKPADNDGSSVGTHAAQGMPAGDRAGENFRSDLRPGHGARRARQWLSPVELEPFTRLSIARSMFAVMQTWALLALFFTLGVWAMAHFVWALPLVVILMATQQHALFVLAHDAAHYRLLPNRTANDGLGRLCAALGGISMCAYRVLHRLHHNHLYDVQDPDIALNGGYPRGVRYLLRKLAIDLTGSTARKTFAYFFGSPAINDELGHRQRPLDDTSPALRRAAQRDRWFVLAVQLALPVIAFIVAGLPGVLAWAVLWALPMLTVLQAILRLRAVAEHGAPAGLDSPLTAARTNLLGAGPFAWLLRLGLFPHHVNYHVEHHLYPAVPHYRLGELHRALADKGALNGAEVRPLRSTMARVFGAAKAPSA